MWEEILKRQWTIGELITLILSKWINAKVVITIVHHYEVPYLKYTIELEERLDG